MSTSTSTSTEIDMAKDPDSNPTPSTWADRFPNTRSFFKYHNLKAKFLLHDPEWYDRDLLEMRLQEQMEIEWRSLDLWTEAEWAELRARLVKGKEWYLRSASAAHLFRDGCARVIWRDGLGPVRMPETERTPRVAKDEKAASSVRPSMSTTHFLSETQQELPLTRSIFPPIKYKHKKIRKPKRTLFVQLPTSGAIKPFQIADACRKAAGSIEQSVCEDAQMWPPGLCVVRLRHKSIARRLAGRHIRIENDELRLRRYPKHHPQVFVAQIAHTDANGTRIESVHQSVAKAIRRVPFHIRSYFNEDESISNCVVVFQRPIRILCFDVDVQTFGGQHMLAHFGPANSLRSCVICRRVRHSVLECDLLEEPSSLEIPESMKDDERYLWDLPKMV